ncbi:NAC domain-containing protein 58-like [Miscanthus floridulus]|uniref:NAC domain-containing protein 58-like n=1 Tax=Miscanthus floridulus TaxID=154761 RepID=UPI00345869C2
MEAWRFGFDPSLFPPAYKFDPTDTDIVVHYLLPRALGVPNPHEHAFLDADPCSCPPWEFMRRNGHADSDHAFFFAPPRARGKRAVCVVSPGEEDGVGVRWDAQKSTETSIVLVRGGGGGGPGGRAAEMPIKYKRCNLSYYHGDEPSTSGWVMHEYQITVPPRLSSTVLSRVKVTDRGKHKQRLKDAAAAAGGSPQQVVVPDPDQPGPSNYDDFVHGHGHDDDDGNALGLSGGEQSRLST